MLRHFRTLFYDRFRRRGRSRGQNLVELALTLPFVLALLFFVIEMGRAWFVYQGAKMAAMEGAHAAAKFHNPQVGQTQLTTRLAASGLQVVSSQVSQIPNNHAYQADVTVSFTPFFGGIAIPSISGPITIIPNGFNISYTAVENVAVY